MCVNDGANIANEALNWRGVRRSCPAALSIFNFFRRIYVSWTLSATLNGFWVTLRRTNDEADGCEKAEEGIELMASGISAGENVLRRLPQFSVLFDEEWMAFQIPFGDCFSFCIHIHFALFISISTFVFKWRSFGNCLKRKASKRQLTKYFSLGVIHSFAVWQNGCHTRLFWNSEFSRFFLPF